jgi:hypothetical protein
MGAESVRYLGRGNMGATIIFPLYRLERVLSAAYQLSRPCVPWMSTAPQLPRWWMHCLAGESVGSGGVIRMGCVSGRGLRLTMRLKEDSCEWLGADRWMDHTQLELETLRDIALGAPYHE